MKLSQVAQEEVQTSPRPFIVGIGGFCSEVGKTTTLCELLKSFPGWEAIKTTRGHYRSCGKDPQACCVSHLLRDEPVVYSGRESTYAPGKDTGRYWESGARNVHWVICTDEQIGEGALRAVQLVNCPGVFIEGNSFTQTIKPDVFIMVANDEFKVKSTARSALHDVTAFYLPNAAEVSEVDGFRKRLEKLRLLEGAAQPPVFIAGELPGLVSLIKEKFSGHQVGVEQTNFAGVAS
jgi:hypothetical protein